MDSACWETLTSFNNCRVTENCTYSNKILEISICRVPNLCKFFEPKQKRNFTDCRGCSCCCSCCSGCRDRQRVPHGRPQNRLEQVFPPLFFGCSSYFCVESSKKVMVGFCFCPTGVAIEEKCPVLVGSFLHRRRKMSRHTVHVLHMA